MKKFLRLISPKRAVVDLANHWQQPTPHRWPILGLALASTFAVFMLFVPPSERVKPRSPDIIYISTWADGRSTEEIIASNCANQLFNNELEARYAERAEIRKEMFRTLGRATFVDVDEIDARIEANRAAEAAAAEVNAEPEPETDPALSLEELCASVES